MNRVGSTFDTVNGYSIIMVKEPDGSVWYFIPGHGSYASPEEAREAARRLPPKQAPGHEPELRTARRR